MSRLRETVATKLRDLGYDVSPRDISSAQGAWRRQDVYRWTAWTSDARGDRIELYCWWTLSACAVATAKLAVAPDGEVSIDAS